MNGKKTKMNRGVKRALIIGGTIVGAISIALIIAFFPSCENENRSTNPNNDINVEVPDTDNYTVSTDEITDYNYENMTKEELIKVVEEKDEKIAELENEVEELTILAEQTTNAIVPPSVPNNSGNSNSSLDDDDEDSSSSSSSSNSSSGSSSSDNDSSDNSSSGSNSSGNSSSSSNSSSDDKKPETSDTGL